MQKYLLGAVGTALALALLGGGYAAGRMNSTQPAMTVSVPSGVQREEVQVIVRDYLLQNPEILLEVQSALAARDQQAQQQQQAAVLEQEHDALRNSPVDGIIGNPNGSTTIIEFFDYNCGYCKNALRDMQTLVQSNPDLRFVMKEFPILGPESQQAHVVSAALRRIAPEKYPEFHVRLMSASGRADEASALRVAVDLGLDENALRTAMKDEAIMEEFAKTYELANKLSITGTPSYVLEKEVVFGAVGSDALMEKLGSSPVSN